MARLVNEHHKAVQLTETEERFRRVEEELGIVPAESCTAAPDWGPAIMPRSHEPPLSPAALADLPSEDAAYPWWRVSIVGPRTLNIEFDMRAAWTVSDWGSFARRHYGPDATVVVRARPEPGLVTEEGAAPVDDAIGF